MISKKLTDEILYKQDIEPYGIDMAQQTLVVSMEAILDTKNKFLRMKNNFEDMDINSDVYYPDSSITEYINMIDYLLNELDKSMTSAVNQLEESKKVRK